MAREISWVGTVMKFLLLLLLSINAYSFDHDYKKWEKVLNQYTQNVDGQILVNYKEIKKGSADFNLFIQNLEGLKEKEFKKFTSDQKLAFWINTYNAFTVKWIIKHYPIKSIKDTGSLFSNPWSKSFINMFGKKMTLDNIEHDFIRKNFKEARIHFAVNCASIGCPSLYQKAFVASKLDSQLEAATKFFLTNKSKNHIKGNTYYLSKIFDWYGDDFKKYHVSVLNFVKIYMGVSPKKNAKIKFLEYNWKLNEYN